jgi:hypothetical protein
MIGRKGGEKFAVSDLSSVVSKTIPADFARRSLLIAED